MRILVISAVLIAISAPSLAQSLDSMTLANDLGSVLAAEEACGLSYDQAAISSFIEKNVPAEDMSFPSLLQTMVAGHEYSWPDMSRSAQTASCAQIGRIAKSYGFTK